MKRCLMALALVLLPLATFAQEPVKLQETLIANDQKLFTPGYPMGDLSIADPTVADFKVLPPNRTELMLIGRQTGRTTLIIWDQKRVKRHEIDIVVTTRHAIELERDMREMIKDYKGVELKSLAGDLVLTGTVDTKADYDGINKIAAAGSVKNLVRYVPSASEMPQLPPQPIGAGTTVPPSPGTGAATGAATTAPPAGGNAVKPVPKPKIEYVLELMEASIAFGSGVYQTGIEPSGRPLVKKALTVSMGEEGEVYFNEPQVTPKDFQGKKGLPEIGIRIRLRPAQPDEAGNFTTSLLVETNVPVSEGTFLDPNIQRRARWEFRSQLGIPVGVGGNELLAIVETARRGPSAASRILGFARVASAAPGSAAASIGRGAGVGSAVPTYDKQKKTQLMVIIRPRAATTEQ
jgi:hypothetical protein